MKIRGAAVLVVVCGASLLAQAPPPAQQPPVFQSRTDLVEVDVIVHDKSGRFVSDFALDDFELQDNGKPQQVQQIYMRLTTSGGWNEVGPVRGQPQRELGGAPATRSPDVFLVVFDDLHLTTGGFKRTQAAALTLFTKGFRPGDFGGVVANGKIVNNRLTSDRDELVKAVKAAQPRSNKSSRLFDEREWPRLTEMEAVRIAVSQDREVLTAAVMRACTDEPDQCKVIDPSLTIRAKASQMADLARAESNQTLQLVAGLMSSLEKFDGRKTVLLLSEGFLADESWPQVQEAVALAARANARLYTLDARGLDKGLVSIESRAPSDAGTRLLEQMDFGADSINSLAIDTGGFVVRNTNLFDRAVAQIVDDATNYYVLGYLPSSAPDGKFHQISVKVKRPGVAVRARRGYTATPKRTTIATAAARPADPHVAAPVASPEPAVGVPGDPIDPSTRSGTAPAAPAADGVVVAPATPESRAPAAAVRVRPDASKHLDLLLPDPSADRAAAAGWEAYQRGDLATARQSLSVAAASPSAEAWVHYALGQADYALRQYADAVGAWEKVHAAAVDFEPVYFDLVDGYLQLKEYDKAIRLLRDGATRWPKDPEIFNALGVVQTTRGALDDAVTSFQQAIAAEPGELTSYFNLGKAMELRYIRSRRYVQATRRWIANENDRTGAIENYKRYLAAGGPYADAAREGLTRLNWIPGAKP